MSIICNKCGRQLPDNAKFCGGCGARVGEAETAVTPGVCPVCKSAIPEGIHFCTVCGTAIGSAQSNEQDVTMDELTPPVITDELFDGMNSSGNAGSDETVPSVESVTEVYTDPIFDNSEQKPSEAGEEPTVEAVTEVYKDSIFVNNNNVPKGYAPEPEAEQPAVSPEQTEPEMKLPETPVIDDSVYRQPVPTPVIPPEPAKTAEPVQNAANTYSGNAAQPYQPQGYQQPSAVPNGYQNPQYQPYPDPRTMQTKAGSSGGILVPIILIILILGVLAFDVFYLFRDKIFDSDDDSSKKSKQVVSVVTIAEDL